METVLELPIHETISAIQAVVIRFYPLAPRQTWKLEIIKGKSAHFNSKYRIRRENSRCGLLQDPELFVDRFRGYQKVSKQIFVHGADPGSRASTQT